MNNVMFNGMGTLEQGKYDDIEINGGVKSQGRIEAKVITIGGILNANSDVQCQRLVINGRMTSKGNVISSQIQVNGTLNANEWDIKATKLYCNGSIQCKGKMNIDDIEIDGLCNISKIKCKKINLKSNKRKKEEDPNGKGILKMFSQISSMECCTVNSIECSEIIGDNVIVDTIKASKVTLLNNCRIGTLYCSEEPHIDESCHVVKIIPTDIKKKNKEKNIKPEKQHDDVSEKIIYTELQELNIDSLNNMEGISVESHAINIDDIFTSEINNVAETRHDEKCLVEEENITHNNAEVVLPWDDDENIRIVLYKGKTILEHGDINTSDYNVKYNGKIENLQCYCNITCNNVSGSIECGGKVTCKNVDGSIRANGDVQCGHVKGNVHCKGTVSCNSINGNVQTDSNVQCETIGGNVDVQGEIVCNTVHGIIL